MVGRNKTMFLFLEMVGEVPRRFHVVEQGSAGYPFDDLPFDPYKKLRKKDRLTMVNAEFSGRKRAGFVASRIVLQGCKAQHAIVATNIMNDSMAHKMSTETYEAMVDCTLKELITHYKDIYGAYEPFFCRDEEAAGDAPHMSEPNDCVHTRKKKTTKKSCESKECRSVKIGGTNKGGKKRPRKDGGSGDESGSDDEFNNRNKKRNIPADKMDETPKKVFGFCYHSK